MSTVLQTNFSDMTLLGRGKVRDIYEVEDKLLIVSTDRISAFDVILPNGVPGKGQVLTELSEFWFGLTKDIVKNHLITTNVDEMPQVCHKYKDILAGRSMLVKKAEPMPVECVIRHQMCFPDIHAYRYYSCSVSDGVRRHGMCSERDIRYPVCIHPR